MFGRTSLVDQKKLQWAKEKEEMARLSGSWGPLKFTDPIRTAICTRIRLTELNGKEQQSLRESGHNGSTSLRSLASENSTTYSTSIQSLGFPSGSLIDLQDKIENHNMMSRKSPNLPPIYNNKDEHQNQEQRAADANVLHQQPIPQNQHHSTDHHDNQNNSCHTYEEREGETSGYASDSLEATITAILDPLMPHRSRRSSKIMSEKLWPKPYYAPDQNSLPPSRHIFSMRGPEFNRPRWGSFRDQFPLIENPPTPSWVERGLSRLDHPSQVLIVNHDSESSPDNSSTGSIGSESNKTYLRGQNLPIDDEEFQERDFRRQKAVGFQNELKQQLIERERQRKQEREKRIREELEEEERIQKERDKERERLEEEQRKQKEKEAAKQKKAEALREVLEAAERLAKEEKKKLRRKRDINVNNRNPETEAVHEPNLKDRGLLDQNLSSLQQTNNNSSIDVPIEKDDVKQVNNQREDDFAKVKEKSAERESFGEPKETNSIRVPVSRNVAIVMSGRLEDSQLLDKANLQAVNLVMTPNSSTNEVNHIMNGLSVLVNSLGGPGNTICSRTMVSPRFVENRLLTPSKYRSPNFRECGTQTDSEKEIQDLQDRIREMGISNNFVKESKDTANNNRRDVEKSTSTSTAEEITVKTLPRTKKGLRKSLEMRPRWNANRPGTMYRTQSEKDPHYKRRMRLRRRHLESSDEGSRSPSPDQSKHNNSKQKTRSLTRRKAKMDSYDADLSMDSLNSIVQLRFDENGRINIEDRRNEHGNINKYTQSSSFQPNLLNDNVDSNIWCGQELLSQLSCMRNGLLMLQKQWDPQKCPVSPITEFY